MVKVEFENRHDVRRVIGECETEQEAFKIIYNNDKCYVANGRICNE